MKTNWLHDRSPVELRKPRINKEAEIITDLAKRHGMEQAPTKIKMSQGWYEVLIPVGKDHVAYLYLPDDTLEEIRKMWGDYKII